MTMGVLLRTLTKKSRFEAGKYAGQTVEVVMDIEPNYIIHEYFDYSKISFTEDVLIAVGITEPYRIEKPGKSDEVKHQMFLDRINSKSDDEKQQYLIKQGRKKKLKNIRINKIHEASDRNTFNKARLKAINQSNTKLNLTGRSSDGLSGIKTK